MNPIALAVILSLNVIILITVLTYLIKNRKRQNAIQHFGDRAEQLVRDYVSNAFPGSVLLNNVYLNTGYGLTQLDHILICHWGVYAIETKSHNGKIEIGDKNWTQRYKDKTISFHSPLKQNEIHKKALAYAIGSDKRLKSIPINGIIVFTSKNVYFSKRVPSVIRLDELNGFIRRGEALKVTTGYKHSRKHRSEKVSSFPKKELLDDQTIQKIAKTVKKKSVTDKRLQDEHKKKITNYKYEHKK